MTDTTTYTVTDEQITALRAEAASAGDRQQVDLCDTALGIIVEGAAQWYILRNLTSPVRDDDYVAAAYASEAAAMEVIASARAECARVIADAAAQDCG